MSSFSDAIARRALAKLTYLDLENNQVGGNVDAMHGKLSTRATLTVAVPAGSNNVTLDFSAPLVFSGTIGIVPETVQCQLQGTWPTAVSTSVQGNTVVVHLATVVPISMTSCAVTCTVDQSKRTSPAH